MAQSVNAGLYGIERNALEVVRIEVEKYLRDQNLTPSFVALLRNTHEMLMKGAKSRAGIDTSGKSPREILVELQQLVVEFQMLVDQENEMQEQGTIQ
jgi:hypothetical protein